MSSKPQRFVLRNQRDKNRLLTFISRLSLDIPWEFNWQPWSPKRSLSANNLYWKWIAKLAKHFCGEASESNKDYIHGIVRHKLLGYEAEIVFQGEVIPAQLKSTSKLNKREMCEYMTRVDVWALEHGVDVRAPEGCEYAEYLESIRD